MSYYYYLLIFVGVALLSCEDDNVMADDYCGVDCEIVSDTLFQIKPQELTRYEPYHGFYYPKGSKVGIKLDRDVGSLDSWTQAHFTIGGYHVDNTLVELEEDERSMVDYWVPLPDQIGYGTHDLIICGSKGVECFRDTLSLLVVDPDLSRCYGTFQCDITLGSWMLMTEPEEEELQGEITIRPYQSDDEEVNVIPDGYHYCDELRCVTLVMPNDDIYAFPVNHAGDLHRLSSYHYHHNITISTDSLTLDIVGPGGLGGGCTAKARGRRID